MAKIQWFSTGGEFAPEGIFWLSEQGGDVLLAFGGKKPELMPYIPQCTGQSPNQELFGQSVSNTEDEKP